MIFKPKSSCCSTPMSNPFSGFINRLQGGNGPAFQPINVTAVPGAFPQEEPVPERRSPLANKTSWILQAVIIKPFVFLLMIIYRLFVTLASTLFYRDLSYYDKINQPIDKVGKFVRYLEENLTTEESTSLSLPPFFQGSYTQALYMATNRAKFLFVYLTNPQNEYDEEIFKNIIINPEFLDLFSPSNANNSNLLIWGGDLTNPEAYQLANSLNVTKFPFLGLLCLTSITTMTPEGPIKSSPKISLISKIQGNLTSNSNPNILIQSKFKNKLLKYEPNLSNIRNDLRNKFMSQVLNKQQEINYQNSLNKDKIKKQKKIYEKELKQFLIYKLDEFKSWPQNDTTSGLAKIAIKFVNGSRKTFAFPPENKIEDIYIYVELVNREYYDSTSLSSSITPEEFEAKFKDFRPKFNFELMSPLPPRLSLKDLKELKIKDVSGVYPNGLLIVEDI